MMPAVSVVVPTYNRSWGLKRAAASVLAQSFPDFELLIVDDASSDDTPEVARSFADPRVRYHRQPHNVGVARNWGTGLELARGEFVALLMDDDRYGPDFLARRVAALRDHPAAVAAFGGYRRVTEDGQVTKTHLSPWQDGAVLTGRNLLTTALAQFAFVGATLYRTAALRSVWAAAEPAGYVVDYAANVRLALLQGAEIVALGEADDFIMADHPGQISHAKDREVFEATARMLAGVLAGPLPSWARPLVRGELASWCVVGGRRAAAAGQRWTAVRRLLRAARLRPFTRAPWTQLVRAVTGL